MLQRNLTIVLINITKIISHSGLCSRREAKELVKSGKVSVNGHIIFIPTTKVDADDKIVVAGKEIDKFEAPRLWIFHKPTGVITTNKDPQNRKTIFDLLPQGLPRVVAVGRLDINSEGLLLLTNNGELARYFEMPLNNIARKYEVRVFGILDTQKLDKLSTGCRIDGISYGPIKVNVVERGVSNSWLEMVLTEGKNREIRKVLASLGLKISRLKRVEYGNYSLSNIKKGDIREVKINKKDYENYIRQASWA
jgi:23S rRNA pseudouridine2605 synthase